jgi:hypothetical protein
MGIECLEGLASAQRVQTGVPAILRGVLSVVNDHAQASFLARLSAPVVDELVAGDADDPGTLRTGGSSPRTASTAARNVSEVRSSASALRPHRAERYP